MKLEHVAINVPAPLELARWHAEHLGLNVVRRSVEPPYGHFLADDGGTVLLEIYGNEKAPCLDFSTVHPASLHFAFLSDDIDADAERLVKAGATLVLPRETVAFGDQIAMLRDPWGICIQLIARGTPLLSV